MHRDQNPRHLTRREFLGSLTAAGLGSALAGCASLPAGALPPNVLLLVPDQLRSAALGCLGNPTVRTPNIDRLAARGTVARNAFAASPVCSPCRSQILSGKYGDRPGSQPGFPDSPFFYKLPHEETTLGEVFRRRGYATGYIGKWHVTPKSALHTVPGYVPPGEGRQGFDFWAVGGLPTGHFDTVYYRDSPEPLVAHGFSCDHETELALDFLRENAARPFLLVVSWNPPHNPYTPPPWVDPIPPEEIPLRPNVAPRFHREAREDLAGYYGLLSAVDHNVGRLLGELGALGIERDTIVLLTSDHGDLLHSHRRAGASNSHKRRPWSEAAQVPWILSWPGTVPAGREVGSLFASVDVLPTLAGLAGLPAPPGVQGRNYSALLRGGPDEGRDSVFLHITSRPDVPFRSPWRAVRRRDAWYAESLGVAGRDWLLYDVAEDPYEMRNLVGEPDRAGLLQDLKDELHDWQRRLGDTLAEPG